MKKMRLPQGFTLIEFMIAVAITVMVATTFLHFLPEQIQFYRRMSVRQQVTHDSRACVETILQRLRNGKARTFNLSYPSGTNPRVDFVLATPLTSGATAYAIYQSNGNVYGQEFPPAVTGTIHLLASNVTSLQIATTPDPGLINVSLLIEAPYDDTGDPTHVISVLLANQTANMVESQ
jgi:prepilin-type N-terminal cleavage/methylation domain-containing protein